MEAPDWLNTSYIQNALKSYYKDPNLRITKCDINCALGKGENFGGVLNRAHVVFTTGNETRQKYYIVKTSYEDDEFAKEKMKPYDIFNREMSIYENVLPKLNDLLREIEDNEKLFAKAIYVDYERSALLFEDLSVNGYVMADRVKRLDMKHVELILRKLAKMHATSAVLNEREGGSLEKYDRGFFNRYTNAYSGYFVGSLDACCRLVSQWPDFACYSKKLRELNPHYMEIGKRCFEPTPGQVNVLAHGDVWTNNLMFKYNERTGQPVDVVVIDFQYSFWGSPTLDLHHFFNTSLKEDIRLHRQDELFKYYHGIFSDTLRKLHYRSNPIPSLHRFQINAEQKRFFAFHSSCIVQPVMINENTKDADFNALMAEDDRAIRFKNMLYQNKVVQQNLRQLLPIFDKRGLLDTNQCR